jgi:zinc transporter ZupT
LAGGLRFGVTAIIGAALGALLLGIIPNQTALFVWQAGSKTFEIRLLKLIVAALMVVFVLFELLPRLRALQFERNKLMLGGALSGFFWRAHRAPGSTAQCISDKMRIK